MFCCKKSVEARVVNNALVVSSLDAKQPKVWRGEMSHVATASLELQEAQGKFRVVLKSAANAEGEEVISCPDKGAGLAAMKTITAALLAGEANAAIVRKGGFFRGFLKLVLYLFLFFVAMVLLVAIFVTPPQRPSGMPGVQGTKTGVLVPAEELFGK